MGVELVSDPDAVTSRDVVSSIVAGECGPKGHANTTSIYGDVDDRTPSNDVRQGRIGGCTG